MENRFFSVADLDQHFPVSYDFHPLKVYGLALFPE
jgi:hypothetical protein